MALRLGRTGWRRNIYTNNPKLLIPIGVAVLIGAIYFGWDGYTIWRQADASKSWPAVAGDILWSGVEKKVSTSFRRRRAGRRTVRYHVKVAYVYEVDGKEYSGDRIAFSDRGTDSSTANNIKKQYSPDAKVKVYYDPAEPGESVLRTEAGSGLSGRVWQAGLLGIIGGALLAYGIMRLVRGGSHHTGYGNDVY